MRSRVIVAIAIATLVSMAALAGSVGAEQAGLPAGNLVKNPGGEVPLGAALQSNPPVFPVAWEHEEAKDPSGQPGKPVQAIRYGPHQFVLRARCPPRSAAAGTSSTAATRAASRRRSRCSM